MPVCATSIIEPSFGKWGSHVVFVGFCQTHGLLALFVAVFVEQAGAPIPSYPFLLLSGAQYTDSAIYAVLAVIFGFIGIINGGLVAGFMRGAAMGSAFWRVMSNFHFARYLCAQKQVNAAVGRGDLVAVQIHPWFVTFAPPMAGALGMRLPAFCCF